jgi:hypothetical protein
MGLKLITGKTGTAHVASADDRARIAAMFGPGEYVVDSGNGCFAATIVDNNNISIGAGDLIAFGTHVRIAYGDTENAVIDSGAVGYNRIDLIVAEYKNTSGVESGTMKVIKGTPTTGTPATPSVTAGNILQGASTNQTILYKVTLNGINIVTCERMFTVVSLPLASIASAYSSSSTYAAGAIVSYGGKLYKCTTAISTPEAWTVGHWTLAVLADLLSAHTHTPSSIGAAAATHASQHETGGSDPVTPILHASRHASGGADALSGYAGLDANSRVLADQTNAFINAQTDSYTLVLSDAGKFIKLTKATAATVTVPSNSSVAFAVGTEIEVAQWGAGQITITPGSGVTLRGAGAAYKTAAQYASVGLKKVATDEWLVTGYAVA